MSVRTLRPAPPATRAPETAAAAPGVGAALPGLAMGSGVLQLKKKKKERANERLAGAVVGDTTASPAKAVAKTFLSKGLRSVMGESGSLRNKLMGRAFGSASNKMTGEPDGKPQPSVGRMILDHFKDSMKQRLATSDLGRAYTMGKGSWDKAAKQRDILKQKDAGKSVAEDRAAKRAKAGDEDDTPSLAGLFDEGHDSAPAAPQQKPIPAAGEPPAPQAPAPPQEAPVTIARDPPLAPMSVSMSGEMRSEPKSASSEGEGGEASKEGAEDE